MNKFNFIYFLISISSLISCYKFIGLAENYPIVSTPSVSTDSVSGISSNSARVYYRVIDTGGLTILRQGICWDTASGPTLEDSFVYVSNNSSSFQQIGNLRQNSRYYVRAFIENSAGLRFSNEVSFRTTENYISPSIVTSEPQIVMATAASIPVEITKKGNRNILKLGIVWSSNNSNPTTRDSVMVMDYNIDYYIFNINNLSPSTKYYVRGFLVNLIDTVYANPITINTAATNPEIFTLAASNITSNSATIPVEFGVQGTATVLEKGVCWDTANNPTLVNQSTKEGAGKTNFNSLLNNLLSNKKYYYKAYFISSTDTIYSDEQSFTTLNVQYTPTVSISNIANITSSSADVYGLISFDGNAIITERGFCFGTQPLPDINNGKCLSSSSNSNGAYSISITELTQDTKYYIRAFARNNVGISYSPDSIFNTLSTNVYTVLYSAPFENTSLVRGTAQIQFNQSTNSYRVFLTNEFSFSEGPDIHVFLSPTPQPIIGNAIDLGKAKMLSGDQFYDINGTPNFSIYKYVSLHCVPFNHFWGAAKVVP